MEYLHTHKPMIVHRDLNSHNILVNFKQKEWMKEICCVCDDLIWSSLLIVFDLYLTNNLHCYEMYSWRTEFRKSLILGFLK
jgi:serine/threonine protein kinase